MVLENLEPKLVWEIFEDVLIKTPRESKKEDKIRKKIIDWSKKRAELEKISISIKTDEIGNILIKKSATPGMESCQPVLLQAHMDMVCETNLPDGFDFDNDPIPVKIQDDGKWVGTQGTTLGADNGIGVAIALALVFDKSENLSHGPLEILFTVDEETGLTGAFRLDVKSLDIRSKILINIDSEDLGIITIGSAGGGDMIFEKKLKKIGDFEGKDLKFFNLTVKDLYGGHSGVEIHLPRANANKLVARCLSAIEEEIEIRVCSWNGGTKHNAITRESSVKFTVKANKAKMMEKILDREISSIIGYYKEFEPEIKISLDNSDSDSFFSVSDSKSIIYTLDIIPHGVYRFSPDVKGLVETSDNLAIIKTEDNKFSFNISVRSSVDAELIVFRRRMHELGKINGWKVIKKPAYPGWVPKPNSTFLQFVKNIFEKELKEEIVIEAIHAGLECGVIGAKIPNLQMISIGPNIRNPHIPEERVEIESVSSFYKLIKKILKNLKDFK